MAQKIGKFNIDQFFYHHKTKFLVPQELFCHGLTYSVYLNLFVLSVLLEFQAAQICPNEPLSFFSRTTCKQLLHLLFSVACGKILLLQNLLDFECFLKLFIFIEILIMISCLLFPIDTCHCIRQKKYIRRYRLSFNRILLSSYIFIPIVQSLYFLTPQKFDPYIFSHNFDTHRVVENN